MSAQTRAILGSEYLAFLSDHAAWPQEDQAEVHAENVVLLVDGVRYDQSEITPNTITASSRVMIVSGDVFEFMLPISSLQAHYDSWLMANHEASVDRAIETVPGHLHGTRTVAEVEESECTADSRHRR
jgi:hypothetical protein